MSPTGDDTPQQGGSLDSSQPDPQPFNPKEFSLDKNVSSPPPDPDNDALNDAWEDNQHIDINADGQHSSGIDVHEVQIKKSTDHVPDPKQNSELGGAPELEQVHDVGLQFGSGPGGSKAKFNEFTIQKDADHVPKPGSTQPEVQPDGGGSDEIYPDKYGRVKVQFHWDQEGEKGGDAPGHELAHTVQQGMGDEGGHNELTHKRPNRPIPVILALIAILLLLLGVGLITIFGGDLTAGGAEDPTATQSRVNQPATDVPTETTTQEGDQPSGDGDQPTTVVTEPPPVVVATEPPAECAAGWLPASGCLCCGTTLTCADGIVAEFNPQCGVGGSSGGGGCQCICPVGNPNCIDTCTGAICTP